jgi:hypothetical protein
MPALLHQSESFFRDIVSDADGVSFHRFQVVAWTIVLTVVFVKDVISGLAMPDFNATLLGWQGLSAATFLGKTTESTIPKNDAAGRWPAAHCLPRTHQAAGGCHA